MNWYLKVIKDNYANFNGRARRKEFWMFYLFHILIVFILAFVSGFLSGSSESLTVMIPLIIYGLATIIPYIAVCVRRLHDTGKSGWFFLISFIPYIGGLIILIFMAQNGNVGPNKYGPDPKAPEMDEIDNIGKPAIEEG
ncbi:DUF805 domain-containing protein [Seonamhaeicola aphaedonensis]|uniref:Uncharacterized membrane protein YhaH (DUF805 family) n=1 Tax=Seonamhaeicola aphaedonensis TaxID=1461338 RepID=A0A3D9HH77_9FLAO|nr:DUF805 domain-containing protein [Seonamhaeicola aphaedonensis]RED48316.1 uncharacterized membrane protein YhaH (DUF805 family) [Seonamhaeicola aphaedonensis]